MPKRSAAELRKLRKREQILVDAMAEIKAWNDEELHNWEIGTIIDGCIRELADTDKKESFLQQLESPKHDRSAEEILKRMRERRDRNRK